MHELQALATLVLTSALALLALAALAATAALAWVVIRLAVGVQGVVGEVRRGAAALADAAEALRAIVGHAEGSARTVAQMVRRLAFLERALERRVARVVFLVSSVLAGIEAAIGRRGRHDGHAPAAPAPAPAAEVGHEEERQSG